MSFDSNETDADEEKKEIVKERLQRDVVTNIEIKMKVI
jgi:hypothetical protein